jgi:tetratricopeptide (TPR) repeat protein
MPPPRQPDDATATLEATARPDVPAAQAEAAAPPPDLDPGADLSPGTRVGRYVVLNPIGAGGMGRVFAAFDPELNRRVALKVAKATAGAAPHVEQWRARFLREAHAMAKLSHPNVVAVHDVGTFGESVFLAMELVEGVTLRDWMARRPRPSWREVARLFAGAARGLAAAHAEGLVHRDFKPGNVLVGKDGRARVTDFGLVRALERADDEPSTAPPPGARPAVTALDLPITVADVVMGTVGYMAPEQYRGAPVDGRTDQFSLCVALYEALHGTRPYPGRSAREIVERMEAGPPAPPRDSRIPAHLRRVLRRGLQPSPADRFPSLDPLIAELERDPPATRRRLAAGAGAVVISAAAAALATSALRERARSCDGGERRLAGVWDEAQRQRLRGAFLSTGKPFAASMAAAVEGALDRYAGDWVRAGLQACAATRIDGSQPEATMQLRMACLDGRLADLRALTALLSAADGEVVQRSLEAVHLLPELESCADADALRSGEPLPSEPAARAQVTAIRQKTAEAAARLHAGKFQDARAIAAEAAAAARALGFLPARAEALAVLGEALSRTGDAPGAEEALRGAIEAGFQARRDDEVAAASVQRVQVLGLGLGRIADAEAAVGFARAAVARAGGRPLLEARLFGIECSVLRDQGRQDEAVDRCARALAVAERSFGPDHPATARALKELAGALDEAHRFGEALDRLARALEVERRVLGEAHPELGVTYNAQGLSLLKTDRHAEARDAFRRARDLLAASVGPEHPFVGVTGASLGRALYYLGQHAEALAEHQRAVEILERSAGPEHPFLLSPLAGIGETRLTMGDARGALPPLERAYAIVQKQPGDPPLRSLVLRSLGKALWESGRDRARAIKLVEQSRLRMSPEELAEANAWLAARR